MSPLLPELTAQTPEQARLLLQPRYQGVLGELMHGEPLSAGDLARRAELPLKQVHHCLTRLQAQGLVAVVAERKRGGRAIKLYQAVAAVYRVPLELTDQVDHIALAQEMFRPFVTGFLRGAVSHYSAEAEAVVLALDAFGKIGANYGGMYRDAPTAGAYGTFGQQKLRPQTQRELEQRLRALKLWVQEQAHAEQDDPDAQDCLLGLLYTRGGLE